MRTDNQHVEVVACILLYQENCDSIVQNNMTDNELPTVV